MNDNFAMPDCSTRNREVSVFCHIGTVLTSSLESKEVFRRVMKVIGDYFNPQHWSLLLMNEQTRQLSFEIVVGADAGKLVGFCLEPGEGVAGWVSLHGKPLVVDDVRKDPRFSQRVDRLLDFTTRSVVCVPLLTGKNRVVGAIELINKIAPGSDSAIEETDSKVEAFTEMDMLLLSSIGVFTGIAVENAFLYQKVHELAMIDSLTGLNNRHYFNEVFQREVERVNRYGHTICVVMMDVDGLKAVNDTHGHLTGDEVLQTIAGLLKTSVRISDTVARFGGDEFVILMPQADESKGRILVERIQNLIDRWNEKPSIPGVRLGVSFGIHAAGPGNVKNIIMGADQALYHSKSLRERPEEITADDRIRRYLRNGVSR
ncbi:MAG: sensor domain-containing diguanylate cyclase [Deltaproteobacteria bacterium]|nr:sensor domain-containing diguanylate cyclase [Deltaproteobacteria bacterium]